MKRSQAIQLRIKPQRRSGRWVWFIIGDLLEDIARSSKGKTFKTSAQATGDARDWIRDNMPRDIARLRYTRANTPKLTRGSRIEKWGDLEWIVQHGDYVFHRRKAMSPTQVKALGHWRLKSLIKAGALFLAVEVK